MSEAAEAAEEAEAAQEPRLTAEDPEEAAEEMTRRGVGRREGAPAESVQGQTASLDELVTAWDQGWAQVKGELVQLRRTRKATGNGLRWLTPQIRAAHRKRNKLKREMVKQQRSQISEAAYMMAKRQARTSWEERGKRRLE